jgi:hypothetical protein
MGYQGSLGISLATLGALTALLGCTASTSTGLGSGGSPGSGGSSATTVAATSSVSATTGAGGSTASSSASATTGSGGSGGSGGAATSSASSGQGGGGGMMDLDAGAGDAGQPPVLKAEVYAHSPDTLYRLDPITKVMTTVGPLAGCSTVIDIALDKNGIMFGTGFAELYLIDKSTAGCTLIATGSYPNSLSFVPAGTVDPTSEALVGYVGTSYVRINPAGGSVTTIGSLGNSGYASSGDLVSLIGGKSYLTVNGNGCSDCLVEVNPKTGAMITMIGPLGHSSVFGLAYWAGTAYGFDSFGALFQIDVQTAATVNIPIPNAPSGLVFYGAGSTTAAPLHE